MTSNVITNQYNLQIQSSTKDILPLQKYKFLCDQMRFCVLSRYMTSDSHMWNVS